jgi:branched-chain amino acid transport system ATP-binding protein
VNEIYRRLPVIVAEGATTIIVEQDVGVALRMCHRLYCFQEGRIALTGRPAELTREQIGAAYFGDRRWTG